MTKYQKPLSVHRSRNRHLELRGASPRSAIAYLAIPLAVAVLLLAVGVASAQTAPVDEDGVAPWTFSVYNGYWQHLETVVEDEDGRRHYVVLFDATHRRMVEDFRKLLKQLQLAGGINSALASQGRMEQRFIIDQMTPIPEGQTPWTYNWTCWARRKVLNRIVLLENTGLKISDVTFGQIPQRVFSTDTGNTMAVLIQFNASEKILTVTLSTPAESGEIVYGPVLEWLQYQMTAVKKYKTTAKSSSFVASAGFTSPKLNPNDPNKVTDPFKLNATVSISETIASSIRKVETRHAGATAVSELGGFAVLERWTTDGSHEVVFQFLDTWTSDYDMTFDHVLTDDMIECQQQEKRTVKATFDITDPVSSESSVESFCKSSGETRTAKVRWKAYRTIPRTDGLVMSMNFHSNDLNAIGHERYLQCYYLENQIYLLEASAGSGPGITAGTPKGAPRLDVWKKQRFYSLTD